MIPVCGTPACYQSGCRCDQCRTAASADRAARRDAARRGDPFTTRDKPWTAYRLDPIAGPDTITRSQWDPAPLPDLPARKERPVTVETGDWRRHAACVDVPLAVFFPETVGRRRSTLYDQARTVCSSCPVRDACLADAIATLTLVAALVLLTDWRRPRP